VVNHVVDEPGKNGAVRGGMFGDRLAAKYAQPQCFASRTNSPVAVDTQPQSWLPAGHRWPNGI
jgi:hypothetical protein